MTSTKNMATRMRLSREIDFTEDFRKKYMTRDYGNYEKYEKNSVEEEVDRGINDNGWDLFYKNNRNMLRNIKTLQSEDLVQEDNKNFEDLLQNEEYVDETIRERMQSYEDT